MWRVALTLHPGSSLLEQTVTLYNRSDLRHRFYWWNTSSVEVQDDSRIIYPMRFTAAHGFADVDTWPVDSSGVDLSVPANHTRGFVSRFAHGSREPFMGIYHPSTHSGVVHYSPIDNAPAKKIWSWGWDDDGRDWRRALSDNESAYLEVQAGLFRNQETYAFLDPQQFLRFHEYYMPVRDIGGFSRANLNGVIHLRREAGPSGQRSLRVGVNVTRDVARGTLRIREGASIVHESAFSLSPSAVFDRNFPALASGSAYTVEIAGADGSVLLGHTEDQYDLVPASEIKTGPQASYKFPGPEARSEGDVVELGKDLELNGKLLQAFDAYALGLARFSESYEINKAAGRLAVHLRRYGEAVRWLLKAQSRISNDPETQYYLGHAFLGQGDTTRARASWAGAALSPSFRPAALVQLAQQAASDGNAAEGLRKLQEALSEAPYLIRAGGLEVALLRRNGNPERARTRLAYWSAIDPANSLLRNEAVKLGGADPSLWTHLAGDPERVLEIAVDYMKLGLYDDALELLERRYPAEGAYGEPGAVLPQDYPLVAYYRGFCRERLGRSSVEDFTAASRQSTCYVFPNRPESLAVLSAALRANPRDATAHFLLGNLYMGSGTAGDAIREWRAALEINPRIPVLHRNLGLALLHANSDPQRARDVLVAGIDVDPSNVDLYLGADQCMSLLGRSPEERIGILQRFPDHAGMPTALVFKRALALLEAGRATESRRLFENRFFPREEFGTNPRLAFTEVQLQSALSLARGGHCDQALEEAGAIGKPAAGLAFTNDGMAPFTEGARFQYYLGELAEICGQKELARQHWARSAGSRNSRQIYFSVLAARRLGDADVKEWNVRLTAALSELDTYLAGSGHFPGSATYAQGMILRALNRAQEAREKLRKAFLLPDKQLSHYLTREALRP